MPRDAQVRREDGANTIDRIGPEFVPIQCGHRPQHGEYHVRVDCIVGERAVRGKTDESELSQGTGRPTRRVFTFEPSVSRVVVNM